MQARFKYLVIIIFLLRAIPLNAQQLYIDSLQSELSQAGMSTHERALTMARLADAVSYRNWPLGKDKYREAITFAKSNHDQPALAYIYAYLTVHYVLAGKAALAEKVLDSAFLYAKDAPALIKGLVWFRKGFLQNNNAQPDEALKSWQTALSYLNTPDGVIYQASIYYSLFGIYGERNDSARADRYAHLCLEKAKESADPEMIVSAWQIVGTDYLDHYRATPDSLTLDSALYAFRQSVNIYRERKGWIKNPVNVALSSLNIADVFMDHYPPWYKDSVLEYINLALDISTTLGHKEMEANCYNLISKFNYRNGDAASSLKALMKEKSIVDSLQPPNYYLSKDLYETLAFLMEEKGDNAQALKYYKQYIVSYKKIFDTERFQTIQRLEAKYENEKKDKALKLLQQRNAFQKKQTYLYVGIAAVAILGLLFLFIAYHFRLKYSLQREKLKDEEAARLQAEQQLLQSQKEQMQNELLAGSLHLEHKNQILTKLKDQLLSGAPDGNPVRRLEKLINEELRVDEDFENVKSNFKEIHPDFFNRLQERAEQKLTTLDLKYCAYIYMRLSAKQIATLVNVEPKSVRMAKYRLKQKIGLCKDDDLEEFIQAIV